MAQTTFENLRLSEFSLASEKEVVDLYTQTFTDSEGENEGQVIGALVAELIHTTGESNYFGCVAYVNETLVGCIFFTRLKVDGHKDALLLSPVAVKTAYQKQGVGSELIQFGLDIASKRFVDAVFTYGDPNYYEKFGFGVIGEDVVKAPHTLSYPKGWLIRASKTGNVLFSQSQAHCVKAFNQAKYW